MKKTTTKSYALRIDGPLVKPLQELKKQNRRSLNAEINAALEAWVAIARGQKATAEVASSKKSAKAPQAEPVQAEAVETGAVPTEAVEIQAVQTEAAPSQPRAKKQSKPKSADPGTQTEATSEPPVASESPAPTHTHVDD